MKILDVSIHDPLVDSLQLEIAAQQDLVAGANTVHGEADVGIREAQLLFLESHGSYERFREPQSIHADEIFLLEREEALSFNVRWDLVAEKKRKQKLQTLEFRQCCGNERITFTTCQETTGR